MKKKIYGVLAWSGDALHYRYFTENRVKADRAAYTLKYTENSDNEPEIREIEMEKDLFDSTDILVLPKAIYLTGFVKHGFDTVPEWYEGNVPVVYYHKCAKGEEAYGEGNPGDFKVTFTERKDDRDYPFLLSAFQACIHTIDGEPIEELDQRIVAFVREKMKSVK